MHEPGGVNDGVGFDSAERRFGGALIGQIHANVMAVAAACPCIRPNEAHKLDIGAARQCAGDVVIRESREPL